MSRLNIDQTKGRMDDIQNAIDDDPREIYMIDLDITGSTDLINNTKLKKTRISGTIYKAFRNSSRFSIGGGKAVSRDIYWLLTKDVVNPKSYIECEGKKYDVVKIEPIRGNYFRVELLSTEDGKKVRGFV
jgi:hypothetical protein